MKVKILSTTFESYWYSDRIGEELTVSSYNIHDRDNPFKHCELTHYIRNTDCVITELPKSFCVKRCDDGIKWGKYIDWLNKTYNTDFCGRLLNFDNPSDKPYYGVIDNEGQGIKIPFGIEIHIDDMIKHIDYMKSQQHIKGGEQFHKESQLTVKMDKEFDLTTDEGRLAYARKYYPIGTKYIPLYSTGESWWAHNISTINYNTELLGNGTIEGGVGFVYASGKWAEIIKEEVKETIMETQKLSRQGLKEIHSVACSSWKITLEGWGSRNPLEDYIILSQKEIDMMFNASDNKQKSVLSKYLKQDDGSVDVKDLDISPNYFIGVRVSGKYEYKSFYLSNEFNWEIKTDEYNQLCLIPTKKK